MTNFERLKELFPVLKSNPERAKRTCPATFVGSLNCIQNTIQPFQDILDVFSMKNATCVRCAQSFWDFDEDAPKNLMLSINSIKPKDVGEASEKLNQLNLQVENYKNRRISSRVLLDAAEDLGFIIVIERKGSWLDQVQAEKSLPKTTPEDFSKTLTNQTTSPVMPRQSDRK